MEHPKYVLIFDPKRFVGGLFSYVIMEHIQTDNKILSRPYDSFKTFEESLVALQGISNGPIVLAYSDQKIDNVHDLNRG